MTQTKPRKSKKITVLLSGGIVSLALLESYLNKYDEVIPVYVQSGFRWEESEIFWIKKFMRANKSESLQLLEVLQLPLRDTYQSQWCFTGVKVPNAECKAQDINLPGRDMLLLTKAAAYSLGHDIRNMAVGYLKGSLSSAVTEKVSALISDTMGSPINILMPYAAKTREDVLFAAREMGFEYSFSCISPKGHHHCGDCYKCNERKMSFFKTGVADKTHYHRSLSAATI
jgi:7-cyano-7-deazaguanine synthase